MKRNIPQIRKVSNQLNSRLRTEYNPEYTSLIAKVGDASGDIWISNRPGYIHARGFDGTYYQVYSDIKDLKNGQVIRIGTLQSNKKTFRVLEVWNAQSRPNPQEVELHGSDHSLGGRDVTPVWMGQFMWWNTLPVPGTLTIQVYAPNRAQEDGTLLPAELLTFDLSSYSSLIPPEGGAFYLMVEVSDGEVNLVPGELQDNRLLLFPSAIPGPSPTAFRIAAFALYGQTEWSLSSVWSDFMDLRLVDYQRRDEYNPSPNSNYYAIPMVGLYRWAAHDSEDTYEFTDLVENILSVHINGNLVDPVEIELSSDGTQMVLLEGPPPDGHIIVAQALVRSN